MKHKTILLLTIAGAASFFSPVKRNSACLNAFCQAKKTACEKQTQKKDNIQKADISPALWPAWNEFAGI